MHFFNFFNLLDLFDHSTKIFDKQHTNTMKMSMNRPIHKGGHDVSVCICVSLLYVVIDVAQPIPSTTAGAMSALPADRREDAGSRLRQPGSSSNGTHRRQIG